MEGAAVFMAHSKRTGGGERREEMNRICVAIRARPRAKSARVRLSLSLQINYGYICVKQRVEGFRVRPTYQNAPMEKVANRYLLNFKTFLHTPNPCSSLQYYMVHLTCSSDFSNLGEFRGDKDPGYLLVF